MEVINVELQVKKDKIIAYENFVSELVTKSQDESGNLSYAHFKKVDCENTYEIIEHWQNEDAVLSHNKTAHFEKFLNEINNYLVTPPDILRMSVNN